MAKSKAYLSFVILFVFLLYSHALAHELRETSPQNQHSYNDKGNNKYSNPTSSQDLELNLGGCSRLVECPVLGTLCLSKKNLATLWGMVNKTTRLEDVGIVTQVEERRAGNRVPLPPPPITDGGKSTRPYNAEVDELGEPKRFWTFPRASRKTIPNSGSRHYSYSATYNPSNFEVTKPKNYVDASVMRHRNMVRPSEIDWKTFRVFQAKTFGTNNGGKTGYDVPRMEDVGEVTKN